MANTTYCYQVRAFNSTGDSGPSNEAGATTLGGDADGDGFTIAQGDCDDDAPNVHPGAAEVCNGVNDDCDSETDEGVTSTFYRDADGDGYGDPATFTQACSAPAGYVTNNADCDDTNAAIHPGAAEICNSADDDCDNQIDGGVTSTFYRDADGDGYGAATNPIQACSLPAGYVGNNTDCNDSNAAIHPGATELCNSVDDDCDGPVDEGLTVDADGDEFSPLTSCAGTRNDCNDNNAAVHPGATEVCEDGIDQDCSGTDTICPPPPQPNLTPYQPSGWSDNIVVSKTPGTNTDSSPLSPTDTLYVDWAVANNGNEATAVRFDTELYVDGVFRQAWYFDPPLNDNFYIYFQDYSLGTLSAGTHTIRIRTDSSGAIPESNEGDNEYTKTITVTAPLVVSLSSIPKKVSLAMNKEIKVKMKVKNIGPQDATVAPLPLTVEETGSAQFSSGPKPEPPLTIKPGRSKIFT